MIFCAWQATATATLKGTRRRGVRRAAAEDRTAATRTPRRISSAPRRRPRNRPSASAPIASATWPPRALPPTWRSAWAWDATARGWRRDASPATPTARRPSPAMERTQTATTASGTAAEVATQNEYKLFTFKITSKHLNVIFSMYYFRNN